MTPCLVRCVCGTLFIDQGEHDARLCPECVGIVATITAGRRVTSDPVQAACVQLMQARMIEPFYLPPISSYGRPA